MTFKHLALEIDQQADNQQSNRKVSSVARNVITHDHSAGVIKKCDGTLSYLMSHSESLHSKNKPLGYGNLRASSMALIKITNALSYTKTK